jgi:hypothetical protein
MSGVLPRELRLDGDIADSIYRIAFGPPRTQTACPPGTLLSCIERTCKISCKCFAVNAGLSVLASGESITLNENQAEARGAPVYRIVAGPDHIPRVEVWSGNSWVLSSLHLTDVLRAAGPEPKNSPPPGICSKDAA